MRGLWILYGISVLVGVAVPLVLIVRDRRIDDDQVTAALAHLDRDPKTLGMLSGGPGRMVDAMVTDLVERGAAQADGGKLTIPPETEAQLTMPRDSPDYHLGWDDALTALAIRAGGEEGIWEVRRKLAESRYAFRGVFAKLNEQRLVVNATRRKWEPAGLALGVLAGIWFATIGMMFPATEYPNTLESSQGPLALAVLGWLPVAMGVGFLMSRRRGYHGGDPRTALGHAVVAKLAAELPADTSQAQRVALGGFAAMTDKPLRKAIQGNDHDSQWRLVRRRGQASGAELVGWELVDTAGGISDGAGDSGGD
jgi:uncharacterized protein (TIGR04222 family)